MENEWGKGLSAKAGLSPKGASGLDVCEPSDGLEAGASSRSGSVYLKSISYSPVIPSASQESAFSVVINS